MKTALKIILPLLMTLTAAESHAERWYSANVGRWLSRDPIMENAFTETSYPLLPHSSDDAGDANEYLFVRNGPLSSFDVLGLCVEAESSPGVANLQNVIVNIVGHHGMGGAGNTLTFTLCCPSCNSALAGYSISANPPPLSWPSMSIVGINIHPARIFPTDWTTISLTPSFSPSGGVCYKIVINVPSRSAENDQSGIARVQAKGICCNIGSPQRMDPSAPPVWPPSPPPAPPLVPTGY